jgi:hypothetical protein
MKMAEIPKEWKPAAIGEEEIDYVLYDLNASGTTASATLTFFDTTEAASGKAVSNMETGGQLPSTQRFLVKRIELLVDVNAAAGDSADVLDSAVLEFYIANKRILGAPAALFSVPVATSQTRTAELGGAVNQVQFELDKYIALPGGTPFRVEMLIGKTAVSATTDLTVMLKGRLVRSM